MTPTAKHPTAVSYTRWSTAEQSQGDSLRRQTALAESYAKQHGLRLLDTTYQDAGLSGFTAKNLGKHGALALLLEAIEQRKLPRDTWILVESLDRISRVNVWDALKTFQRILDLGATLVTLQDGQRYSVTSVKGNWTQLIVALSVGARAHEESSMKANRLRSAWSAKKEQARTKAPQTAICPAWLELDRAAGKYKVRPGGAQVVRRVFEMAADGMGKEAITRTLNAEKVPTIGRGKGWHASYVQLMLASETVLGVYQPHRVVIDPETGKKRREPDGESVPGFYPAVIPPALWQRVRAKAVKKDGRSWASIPPGPRQSVSNLFAGLCVCACGGAMMLDSKGYFRDGSTARYLDCRNKKRGVKKCDTKPWPLARTEKLLLTLLSRVIPWATLLPTAKSAAKDALAVLEGQAEQAATKLHTAQTERENVLKAIRRGIDSPTLAADLSALDIQVTTLTRTAEDLRGQVAAQRTLAQTAREMVEHERDVLALWQAGKLTGEQERARLSTVLRERVKRIVMRDHKDGAKDGGRRLTVLLRVPGEAERGPDDFLVSADLSTVTDPDDGTEVVRVTDAEDTNGRHEPHRVKHPAKKGR
jgi:DNA invertase Pin-like site-specific DNA recombinase/flagellar biosynthesis chaperone FliJ